MILSNYIDMAAALAVTALLAESYGAVRRRLVGDSAAPIVIGVSFGLMTVLHMHNPLVPFEGVIIDLRNIPIALAGAFLGWRGLIPCLAIAVSARIGIGGVGMVAGLWGMVIAGLAGIIWARKLSDTAKHGFAMLLLLGLAMSAHLLGAVALPRDMAVWFFTNAAGPILAMNLVTVPLIGSLLERENRRIRSEKRRRSNPSRDPDTGFLSGHAFVREVTSAFAAHPLGAFAGVLVIAPDAPAWRNLFRFSNRSKEPEVEAGDLSEHLKHWALAGRTADGTIVVPISGQELETVHRLRAPVRDALSQNAIDGRSPLYWHVSQIATPDPGDFLRLIERAALLENSNWRKPATTMKYAELHPRANSFVTRSRIFNPDEHEALFAKANFLIERGRG